MSFFHKKKKEEYEEDSPEKNRNEMRVNRKFPKNKAFKDLKPENKKRRREPPKIWTKKDRILLLLILVITVSISAYLALSARDFKLPGLPRLDRNSLKLFGEEEIVIENNKMNKDKATNITNGFKQDTDSLSGVYGLYVMNLADNYNFGIYENDIFQAASLIKLPVMVALYMESDNGSLSLNTKYQLKNSDKVTGAGSLYTKPEGYEITYQDLLRLMGKQSDNTAFRIVRNILGDGKINSVIKKLGMNKTSLANNDTSPADMGIIFEKLWKAHISDPVAVDDSQDDFISKKSADEILDYLTDTSFENWLAGGVPKDIRVAHKYGRETNVVNDAGIVFTPQAYIVVIMTKGVVEREADNVFPELSKMIYNQMTSSD